MACYFHQWLDLLQDPCGIRLKFLCLVGNRGISPSRVSWSKMWSSVSSHLCCTDWICFSLFLLFPDCRSPAWHSYPQGSITAAVLVCGIFHSFVYLVNICLLWESGRWWSSFSVYISLEMWTEAPLGGCGVVRLCQELILVKALSPKLRRPQNGVTSR